MRILCLQIQEVILRQGSLVLLRQVYLCGFLSAVLRLQVQLAALQAKRNFPNHLL